ncbi:MAG: hypothetical protein U0984_06840, partial [Prosthecobacter sp.]|nr:hypothetical protein [Prosthecobacter sp.]
VCMDDDPLRPELRPWLQREGGASGTDVFHVKFTGWEWYLRANGSEAVIHTEKTKAGMMRFVDQLMKSLKGLVIFYREDGSIESQRRYSARAFNPEAVADLVQAAPEIHVRNVDWDKPLR